MKKLLALLCVVCIAFSVAACDTAEPAPADPAASKAPSATADAAAPADPAAPAAPAEPSYDYDFIRIGTASVGGQFYNFGSAFSSLINEKMGMNATAEATPGSAANCDLVVNGDVEMALCQGNTLNEAVTGTGAFAGLAPYDTLRSVAVVSFNLSHIIIRTDANIKSLKDFQGKNVGLGPIGGANDGATRLILKAAGVTDFNPIYGTMTEVQEGLKSGTIDCSIMSTQVGGAAFAEVIATDACELLSLDPAFAEEYASGDPSLSVKIIPAGVYSGEDEDVVTVGVSSFLFCDESLSEDFVYDFCKTFYENNEYLVSFYAILENAIPENATNGLCLPLHAGAEKYLKEIGIL